MNDTLELILVVIIVLFFYSYVIWSITKSISRILEGRKRLSKTIPFALASATFFGTTIWGIIAIIFGDGHSDNPAAPFPPIALLSSVFAAGVWLLSTVIILTYNWLFGLWVELKDE